MPEFWVSSSENCKSNSNECYIVILLRLIFEIDFQRKDPNDFLLYADYLHGALKLVRLRRKLLNYKMKNSEVVKPMKAKIAFLYKTVTSRFPVIVFHF